MKSILVPLTLLLAACDVSPPPQPQTDTRPPNPVFETQIQAIEKARAVEGQMTEAAEAQKRQLDAAGQ